MFGVTGAGLHFVKRFANEGKKTRWNRDLWDRVSQLRTHVGCGRYYRVNVLANFLPAK